MNFALGVGMGGGRVNIAGRRYVLMMNLQRAALAFIVQRCSLQ